MSDVTVEQWVKKNPLRNCPDCGVKPGEAHNGSCDVERCSVCKGQYFSCGCEGHDPNETKWTGWWPGELECVERGWFAKCTPGVGWERCKSTDEGAMVDLNRLTDHRLGLSD